MITKHSHWWRSLPLVGNMSPLQVLRVALTALGLGAAFTTAATIEVGLGFLPLIDKGHLALVVGFYATATLVFFSLVRVTYSYSFYGAVLIPTFAVAPFVAIWRLLTGQGWERIKRSLYDTAGMFDKGGRLALLSRGLQLCFAVFGIVALLRWALVPNYSVAWYIILSGFWTCFTGVVVLVAAWFTKDDGAYRSVTATLGLLLVSYGAGQLWIDSQRLIGNRVWLYSTAGGEHRVVTIAMPAIDGLLVFIGEDTEFIPYSSIDRITSPMRAKNPPQPTQPDSAPSAAARPKAN